MKRFSDSLRSNVENDRLSPNALNITSKAGLDHFNLEFQYNTSQLNMLDSCYYIFTKKSENDPLEILTNQLNKPFRIKLDNALKLISIGSKFLETSEIPLADNKTIQYWLQTVDIGPKIISMEGFAFIDSTNNNRGDSIFVTLRSSDRSYIVRTIIVQRPDINLAFQKPYLNDAGFNFIASTENVEKGIYNWDWPLKIKKDSSYIKRLIGRSKLKLLNKIHQN